MALHTLHNIRTPRTGRLSKYESTLVDFVVALQLLVTSELVLKSVGKLSRYIHRESQVAATWPFKMPRFNAVVCHPFIFQLYLFQHFPSFNSMYFQHAYISNITFELYRRGSRLHCLCAQPVQSLRSTCAPLLFPIVTLE
jgi:hypothetical protein